MGFWGFGVLGLAPNTRRLHGQVLWRHVVGSGTIPYLPSIHPVVSFCCLLFGCTVDSALLALASAADYYFWAMYVRPVRLIPFFLLLPRDPSSHLCSQSPRQQSLLGRPSLASTFPCHPSTTTYVPYLNGNDSCCDAPTFE